MPMSALPAPIPSPEPAASVAAPALSLVTGSAPRPRPAVQRRWIISLRWVIGLTAAALTAAAVMVMAFVSESDTRNVLTREIESRLLLQARNLALTGGDAMLADFPELTLHPLALQMKTQQPELILVELLDHQGVILGDPDPRRLGKVFVRGMSLRSIVSQQALRKGEQLLSDGALLVAAVPVLHRDGRRIGTSMVGLRLGYLQSILENARRKQLGVLALVLLVGLFGAVSLMSVLLRPLRVLRAGIERIGRGDLDTPVELSDRTELGLLSDAVNRMAGELKNAQAELVERERLAHELDLAREIQASLLPHEDLRKGAFVVKGSNRPAQEVGGDYFDYFELPDGRVGIAIADVSGKGLAGCMVSSMLSALLRAYCITATTPAGMLTFLDERLSKTLQRGSFVTMVYGMLDTATGELVFANAGHCPLFLFRRQTGRTEALRSKGVPLAAVRGRAIQPKFRDERVSLAAGDMIVAYTDGINEAFHPKHRVQFGFDRIGEIVKVAAPRGVAHVLAELHHSVEAWVAGSPPTDDETVIALAREADPPAAGAPTSQDATQALQWVSRTAAGGGSITIDSAAQSLDRIGTWLRTCAETRDAKRATLDIVRLVLHEVCDNILEHGYPAGQPGSVDLWLLPGAEALAAAGDKVGKSSVCMMVRDRGSAFQAESWKPTDFSDRSHWGRGRGYGLDIINRGASHIAYYPGTPHGNITLLVLDLNPAKLEQEDQRHA